MKPHLIFFAFISFVSLDISAQKIPFHFDNHLYLDVVINDLDTSKFIFDTGANGIFFDKEYLKELEIELKSGIQSPYNQEVHIPGAGKNLMRVLFAEKLKMTLGDSVYLLKWPFVLPLDSLIGPALGREFNGIIGYDMVKKETMSIDYEDKMLVILSSLEARKKYGNEGWIPFTMVRGKVNLPISIELVDGTLIETEALLDVGGAHSLILTNQLAETHDLFDRVGKKIPWANPRGGVGGMLKSTFCRVAKLKVGEHSIETPVTQLSQNKRGAFGSNVYGANIGNRILSRFTLVFDFTKDRLKMIPNSSWNDPHIFSYSGIIIRYAKETSSFVVTKVLENSSGFNAGVLKGDKIIGLNDLKKSSYSFAEAQQYVKIGEGGLIKLDIERDGEKVYVELEAKEVL